MNIHPTSFVDPLAELGEDVTLGPFAVIEAQARVGNGCVIEGHAQLIGSVTLGENCEIGHSAVVGGAPQDQSFDRSTPSGVIIGAGTILREHVTIHRGSREGENTVIGRDNLFMVGCHLGHDGVVGDRNILANQCLLGGHVHLGNGAFLGGGTAVHQFVRLGDHCMTQGLSGVSQDVPPYVLISGINRVRGLNVVGMRRAGLSAATRQNIKDAFHQLFLAGLNLREALASTDDREWEPEARAFIEFFRLASKRGVCHP